MSSNSFQQKRAIITGAGSGINLGLAKALHAKGVCILILDRSLHHDATQWLAEIEQKGGPTVTFLNVDVTSWDQLEEAFDFFTRRFGGAPEIVVAGAGIYEASSAGFWDDKDIDSHYKLFDVDLVHPVKITRIAIRRLQQARKPGVILHLSSIAAQKPNIVLPLYGAAKAALSHFIRCMAPLEAMCGIRVVGVAPGVVDTPLFRDHPRAIDQIDFNKDFVLPPEEVVMAMLALLKDSKYASGTVLEIGDLSQWREVQLLNDPGPQGRSTLPRSKAASAIKLVEQALKEDQKQSNIVSRL